MFKTIISTFTILLLTCSLTFAQSEGKKSTYADQAYEDKLLEMFEVTGSSETYSMVMIQMIELFKSDPTYNSIPEKFWEELYKEFNEVSINDLTKLLVPVYEKHLNLEDLQGIIDFYKSPVGIKYASSVPAITEESMQVGQEWGMKFGEKVGQRIKNEGY